MRRSILLLTFALAGLQAFAAAAPNTNTPAPATPSEPPTEWIDAATGHRLVRLSKEPGSVSLYFHQNAYTPQGDKLIISTPGGLSTVNLKTREVELVAPGVRYGMGSSARHRGRTQNPHGLLSEERGRPDRHLRNRCGFQGHARSRQTGFHRRVRRRQCG